MRSVRNAALATILDPPPAFKMLLRVFCLLVLVPSSLPISFVIAQAPVADDASITTKVIEALASSAESEQEAAQHKHDRMRTMQRDAVTSGKADWGHWGSASDRYSTWTTHSNRLIPLYTFGITLDQLRAEGSPYRSEQKLQTLYGRVPDRTLVPDADYLDQTDVYKLQQQAVAQGKTQVILIVFDGMDWNTTYCAALYHSGQVGYREGRGDVLSFQNYRGATTDFGYFVTSAKVGEVKFDVDAQTMLDPPQAAAGGYDPERGGRTPWSRAKQKDYLIGLDRTLPHTVTDSASSATSMASGIKTYNAAINVTDDGKQVVPIGRQLQLERNWQVGVVTSVAISHATPAAAYANNVSRDDYQDLTRDLIGLPSVAHKQQPLPGVDVLIGAGWGKLADKSTEQGSNFVPGPVYYDAADLDRVSLASGGRYVVVQRQAGQNGAKLLRQGAAEAIAGKHRFVGVFGHKNGNLPFQTADGRYNPTVDVQGQLKYSSADLEENPTLADMTAAALDVLGGRDKPFWLMVEAGDVDWANHANNLDSSIGAVLSGEKAVQTVFDWVQKRDQWDQTAVIVTADHGHYFILTAPEAIARAGAETRAKSQN